MNLEKYLSILLFSSSLMIPCVNAKAQEEDTKLYHFNSPTFNLLESDYNSKKRDIIERNGNIHHEISKTIIVDRDARPQKMYLIEGDKFNPFANIVGWSLVSTGLREAKDEFPTQPTPLGYYYVKSKEKRGFNGRGGRNWKMPFVLWFTKNSGTPEGINGLHAYDHTVFGRPASHGCVRIPNKFAEKMFEWAKLKTPVFIIGKYDLAETDSTRFNFEDYDDFKSIIKNLEIFEEKINKNNSDSSCFSKNGTKEIKDISDNIKKAIEKPFLNYENSGKIFD